MTLTPSRLATLTVLCSFALVPTPSVRGQEPAEIPWREDYGQALREAESANRLVWIQFTGPWCPNCRRMERDSFPDQDVIGETQNHYIPVKLRSDVHEQLAAGFQLSGLPATVVIAPDRTILTLHQGYLGPDELANLLRQAYQNRPSTKNAKKPNPSNLKPASHTRPCPPSAPTTATASSKTQPLALRGCCPVSLVQDRKLVPGKPGIEQEYLGITYRFASPQQLQIFQAAPERFVPANSANCPVNQLDRGRKVPGDPRFGALYAGRLYVCASQEDRARFLESPERFASVDVAENGFCPHCLRNSGLLVRGNPHHELARDGQRFWFPDPTHRDAFLTAFP